MERISEKNRFIMGGALAVLVVIALIIKTGGGAATKLAEQMLASQNVVAGTLEYEKINAGFAGDVEIRNLTWKAPNGQVKMQLPMATVSVNFFDALRNGGGIASVTNIVLNRPEFHGVYVEGQGLDLLNLLQFAGKNAATGRKLAGDVEDRPTRFRGLIELKDGVLKLDSNGKEVVLSRINSQMAFKQYPVLRASTTASKNDCDLVLNMTYETGTAQVTGEMKNAAVADLLAMYPDLKNIKVASGRVPTVKVVASKDDQGWHIQMEGKPRNMSGEFFDVPFTDGEGSFSADRDVTFLQNLQANVYGMPVTMRGTIKSGRGTPLPPGFDLTFSADRFKTQSLSSGMYLDDAAVSFTGKVTGTAVEPKLTGDFRSAYIFAEPLKLMDVKGEFIWENGKITLKNASAQGAGAAISLAGYLNLPGKEYAFSLAGNNMDAAQLTENRVTGLVSAEARITGKNQVDSAVGDGQFSLRKGRYYYSENGPRSEELRFLEGNIVIQNGRFGTKKTEMKLGRTKYEASIITNDKGSAEIKIGEKTGASLF
ncbi:MAG: hypothetical protein J6E49_07790 [Acidaminococcaceae bacterium]|nr:hypothetical protein [Acidaminococcaceae bacterium]